MGKTGGGKKNQVELLYKPKTVSLGRAGARTHVSILHMDKTRDVK